MSQADKLPVSAARKSRKPMLGKLTGWECIVSGCLDLASYWLRSKTQAADLLSCMKQLVLGQLHHCMWAIVKVQANTAWYKSLQTIYIYIINASNLTSCMKHGVRHAIHKLYFKTRQLEGCNDAKAVYSREMYLASSVNSAKAAQMAHLCAHGSMQSLLDQQPW